MRVYMILCRSEGDMSFIPRFTDDPSLVKDLLKKNECPNAADTTSPSPRKMEVVVYVLDTLPRLVKLDIKTDEIWEVSVEKNKDENTQSTP